jgi:hypothetical protein
VLEAAGKVLLFGIFFSPVCSKVFKPTHLAQFIHCQSNHRVKGRKSFLDVFFSFLHSIHARAHRKSKFSHRSSDGPQITAAAICSVSPADAAAVSRLITPIQHQRFFYRCHSSALAQERKGMLAANAAAVTQHPCS